jgi:hypothetical protein
MTLEITAAYFKLYLTLLLLQRHSSSKNHLEHESGSKSAWCSALFRMAPFLPRVILMSTHLSQFVVTANFVDWNFVSVSHFLCVCCKSHLPYPRFPHRNDIYESVIISYVWKHLPAAQGPGHSTHAEVSVSSNRGRSSVLCAADVP